MKTNDQSMGVAQAQRFAAWALACIHREFPNKISHLLASEADVAAPRRLTPVFYGCYDWHSAVHNHWLLARLAGLFPDAPFAAPAKEALARSLTEENISGEIAYLEGEGRQSFERPYGLAWLLALAQELREWDEAPARSLAALLAPFAERVKQSLSEWLPKLEYPVRSGEHSQTAFAVGLMIDYARGAKDQGFLELLTRKARRFFLDDKNWPLEYEPSGEDFLSPGLAEADLLRRVLTKKEFAEWLGGFWADFPATLHPVKSPDHGDPKFSHLDGLNLSRAWMLKGIASGLPEQDRRIADLLRLAESHARAGLAAITGEHYVGSHWLGTFAVYLLTDRGIRQQLESEI
jgi:hypothetical protein